MTVLAPLGDADWPGRIADMRAGFAGKLNVYRLMAHHPELMRAWGPLRAHVVGQTALGPTAAEIVILRLAARLGCGYEWNQHVLRGLKAGLDKDLIAALRGPHDGLSGDAALLAGAVDALLDQHRLPDAQARALIARFGKAAVLDLMATLGMYLTLGFILNTFPPGLEPEQAQALQQLAPELAV